MNIEIGFWEVVLMLVMSPVLIFALYYSFWLVVGIICAIGLSIVGLVILIIEVIKAAANYIIEWRRTTAKDQK